jgi:cytochrome c oxidase subunit II
MTQPPAGRPRPSASTIIAAILILILAVVVVVSALTVFQLPHAVTEQGKRTTILYQATLIISFIVFFGVTAALIWAVFRYRRKSPDDMPEQIHGSSTLEAAWTIIPILILVALFIPSLILVIDLKTPPSKDKADLTVQAVGHQWWWEFDYPDDNIRVQQTPPNYNDLKPPALVVPVDKTILIQVRSTDVIHSFSAPHTLYKIQAIPGNVNEMHLKFEETGTFTGQCYQFCGLRHADMRFVFEVMSQSDYDRWLRDTKRAQSAESPTDLVSTGVGDTGRSE